MKASITCLSAAACLALGCVSDATLAACSHETQIKNNSATTLRFAELKSSSSPPVFKSQWTGSRVIAPGATGTISWTSDLSCTDGSGVDNDWDVKFYRNNGQVHYCSRLRPGQDVKVDTPDLCFPD